MNSEQLSFEVGGQAVLETQSSNDPVQVRRATLEKRLTMRGRDKEAIKRLTSCIKSKFLKDMIPDVEDDYKNIMTPLPKTAT